MISQVDDGHPDEFKRRYDDFCVNYATLTVSDAFFHASKGEEWFQDRYNPLRLLQQEEEASAWAKSESSTFAAELQSSPSRVVAAMRLCRPSTEAAAPKSASSVSAGSSSPSTSTSTAAPVPVPGDEAALVSEITTVDPSETSAVAENSTDNASSDADVSSTSAGVSVPLPEGGVETQTETQVAPEGGDARTKEVSQASVAVLASGALHSNSLFKYY
jgi:hypothetical protein